MTSIYLTFNICTGIVVGIVVDIDSDYNCNDSDCSYNYTDSDAGCSDQCTDCSHTAAPPAHTGNLSGVCSTS